MKRIAALAVAGFAMLASCASRIDPASDIIVVTDDLGGRLGEYLRKVAEAKARHAYVEIYGVCASACTLWLSVENICIDQNAALLFHAPFRIDGIDNEPFTQILLNSQMLSAYPEPVRQWVLEHGGLSKQVLTLTGPALQSMFNRCK